jgi:hypothetical protein
LRRHVAENCRKETHRYSSRPFHPIILLPPPSIFSNTRGGKPTRDALAGSRAFYEKLAILYWAAIHFMKAARSDPAVGDRRNLKSDRSPDFGFLACSQVKMLEPFLPRKLFFAL